MLFVMQMVKKCNTVSGKMLHSHADVLNLCFKLIWKKLSIGIQKYHDSQKAHG